MNFIKQYMNLIVGGTVLVVGLGLYIYINSLKNDIEDLTDKNQNLNLKLSHMELELTKCENSHETMRKAIEQLKKDGKTFDLIFERLDEYVQDSSKTNEKVIERLKNLPDPQTCDDIKEFLKDNIGELNNGE